MADESIVEEYWAGAVSRLQAEVDVFNRLIGHEAEKGRENELSLVRLLESLLPSNVGVGSGIVIDRAGRRSKQTDIILYDRATQPSVMAQTTQAIFPVEVVLAAIEVKTTLSPVQLKDCGEKRQEVAKLEPAGSKHPHFYVFAYHYTNQPRNLGTALSGMAPEAVPDALCVVSPGVVARRTDESLQAGLCVLHQRDGDGNRLLGTRTTFEMLPTGGVYRHGESSLPVTKAPNGEFVACEPGRALLLFCERVLIDIASRAGSADPILSLYLDDIARETVSIVVAS